MVQQETGLRIDVRSGDRLLGVDGDEGGDFIYPDLGQIIAIVLNNLTNTKLLAIVAINGFNVADGSKNSEFGKGFIVPPSSQMTIDEWPFAEADEKQIVFGVLPTQLAVQQDFYRAGETTDRPFAGKIQVVFYSAEEEPAQKTVSVLGLTQGNEHLGGWGNSSASEPSSEQFFPHSPAVATFVLNYFSLKK